MTVQGDPYRTLGLAPGASLNEIKSAYRRLAKRYHPDAAGERALSRFLAIQAAYERLVDDEGQLRQAGPSPAETVWPRASRDAWRARRTGRGASPGQPSTDGDRPGPAPGQASSSGQGTGPRARSGASTGAAGTAGGARTHARRGSRKATPGSTTYDEAVESPLDPEWEGGAWYGPSSGTYWTLNPREYADPRKHGPEYLARARRAMSGADPAEAPRDEDPAGAPRAEGDGGAPQDEDPAEAPRAEGEAAARET